MLRPADSIEVAIPLKDEPQEPKAITTSPQNMRLKISPPQSDFPRSHTTNWAPTFLPTSEAEALSSLKAEWKRYSRKLPLVERETKRSLVIIDLHDFEIYRSPHAGAEGRRYELISLHHLEVPMPKKLCFDGFLCVGNSKHYVQAVPIQDSSIEGYGNDDTPVVIAYVQSELASKDQNYDIWFRLIKPTREYSRFHEPFLWVGQLAKHVLDYMDDQPVRTIGLESFHTQFYLWLTSRFAQNEEFQQWHRVFRDQIDFRVTVNANVDYIYHQAFNLPNSRILLKHSLWGECMTRGFTSVQKQDQVMEHTIATPHVYESFKDMYFGSHLQKMKPSDLVRSEQDRQKRRLGFPNTHHQKSTVLHSAAQLQPYGNLPIIVGDVVAMVPDANDQQLWRNADWEWLAYVQAVTPLHNSTQRLQVLWLYRPRETNIFKAKYPFENELFLSDNCNCDDGELLSTDVKGRYPVDWTPITINPNGGFFIRQTYITQDSAFVTLHEDHKTCMCKREKSTVIDDYVPGDTVYLCRTVQRQKILDPTVVKTIDKINKMVTVRKLLRLGRDCADLALMARRSRIPPNELVLTDDYEEVSASRIQRRCSIRFVPKRDIRSHRIPFLYDRGGAGDLWITSMGRMTSDGDERLLYLARLPDHFNEGPDMTPKSADQKLRGLSIFSGGGSLDRGLEEGGAVEFHTAVDLNAAAIHTQRANTLNPSTKRLYWGSVDDFFKSVLSGSNPKLVAKIGEVEMIAAGSPCPGFSALQQDFLSVASLRNASHISTFCSFVDMYRPIYGILENVVNMASTRTGFEDQNVLSQVVASLVSMGYQVHQYIMDAWSYGSMQQRSRILLCVAAPGLNPIVQPWHTHNRPYEDTKGRSLGKLPNDQRFGEREHYPTPFTHVSAGEATSDLPNIGNGNVQTCIPYPDHRLSRPPNRSERALLEFIPKHPPGCGYKEAFKLGLIPPLLQKNKKETGKAFKRIKEAGLVPTITTDISPQDSRNGACIHWSQDRPISLLDARRTQGYLDDEPIIGSLSQQYEIVGNGVDRKVSLATGLALRQAVARNTSSYGASSISEAKQNVETTRMVFNEDGYNDFEMDVMESGIHVHVPPHKNQPHRRLHPSVVIPSRPTDGATLANDQEQTVGMRLPEARASCHTPPVKPLQPATSFFSRMTKTVTARVGNISISSIGGLSSSFTRTVPKKRSRRDAVIVTIDESSMASAEEEVASNEQSMTRKRARTGDVRPTRTDPPIRSIQSSTDLALLAGDVTTSTQIRQTRHSGLSVKYAPRHWNRKPEWEQYDHDP